MMAISQQRQWTKPNLDRVWERSHLAQLACRCTIARCGFTGSLAISSWAIVLVTTAATAQQVVPLPPPPTVSVPGLTTPFSNVTPSSGSETVFLAPVNRQSAVSQYTVYVNGDSPYLLQQVRSIEPNASIQRYQGQSVIQAGTFEHEASARRQVAALNAQGIMAELTTSNTAAVTPSSLTTTSRYLVVIPGSQGELPTLADRAIRMGIRQEAIQQKNAPLGPHLEIGPFLQHSDAKKISQFLNGGGFDARVYYSR